MARDYSKFLRNTSKTQKTNTPGREPTTLDTLGWKSHFARQINPADEPADEPDDEPGMQPVRVTEVHRAGLHVVGNGVDMVLPPDGNVTVGDWLLVDPMRPQSHRLLARKSLIKRRAPGTDRRL